MIGLPSAPRGLRPVAPGAIGAKAGNSRGEDGAGFNPYAAGIRRYGASGTSAPTVGAVDKTGYAARDARAAARKNALMRRAQGM